MVGGDTLQGEDLALDLSNAASLDIEDLIVAENRAGDDHIDVTSPVDTLVILIAMLCLCVLNCGVSRSGSSLFHTKSVRITYRCV